MSMKKVAERAGVSISTVSRVVNRRNSVIPELVHSVREAMAAEGYTPRAVRPGPRPKLPTASELQTSTIGLLLVGRTRELLDHPFMARALAGVQQVVQENELDLTVIEMATPDNLPPAIRKGRIGGLIINGPSNSGILDTLHPIPCVWLAGSRMPLELCDQVLVDDRAAGALAGQYLLGRGCSRSAFVNTVPGRGDFADRRDAFIELIRNAGQRAEVIESATDEPEQNLWSVERMRADLSALVDRICRRTRIPDGFFFPTDQQSAIFQALMRNRGIKPGTDFHAVSCNRDEPWLVTMDPRPATVDTRPFALGQVAARQLIRRIGNPADPLVSTTIRPELVSSQVFAFHGKENT
jgi:LacI family transcriptional regulator